MNIYHVLWSDHEVEDWTAVVIAETSELAKELIFPKSPASRRTQPLVQKVECNLLGPAPSHITSAVVLARSDSLR